MERNRLGLRIHHSGSSRPRGVGRGAEDRANYFGNLQKGLLPETLGRSPTGQQATTLLELMTIRASHSKILRRFSLGTAIGFRIQSGILTDIPAILVFVARKAHRQLQFDLFSCIMSFFKGML
ncbi:hypothetical protein OIU84_001274 [Salix udensis]|uniref:Nal1 N-terminal domain-containing protein n=1 Tax=Salix udensis TaxID=889485 RepID=A0AAD6K750_9ROSI|nr:hypothetical protein OIU84_001274 [Salix udensis]